MSDDYLTAIDALETIIYNSRSNEEIYYRVSTETRQKIYELIYIFGHKFQTGNEPRFEKEIPYQG